VTELRLASVDGQPTIAIGPTSHIAAEAQGFADAVNDGRLAIASAIIVVVDENGVLDLAFIGEPMRVDQGIGQLELAKTKLISGCSRE
jgi:hypothetical protein